MMEKMKDNSEPEEDRAVGTDYSAEEAEQMGAFVEDAKGILPFVLTRWWNWGLGQCGGIGIL